MRNKKVIRAQATGCMTPKIRKFWRKNRSFGGTRNIEILVETAAAEGLGIFFRPRRGPRAGARVIQVTRRVVTP